MAMGPFRLRDAPRGTASRRRRPSPREAYSDLDLSSFVPDTSAPERSAPSSFVPFRFAPDRSASFSRARDRSASPRLAPDRSAWVRLAPDRSVPERLVPLSLAPERLAPERSLPERSLPDRSRPDRSAPDRSLSARFGSPDLGSDRPASPALPANGSGVPGSALVRSASPGPSRSTRDRTACRGLPGFIPLPRGLD